MLSILVSVFELECHQVNSSTSINCCDSVKCCSAMECFLAWFVILCHWPLQESSLRWPLLGIFAQLVHTFLDIFHLSKFLFVGKVKNESHLNNKTINGVLQIILKQCCYGQTHRIILNSRWSLGWEFLIKWAMSLLYSPRGQIWKKLRGKWWAVEALDLDGRTVTDGWVL